MKHFIHESRNRLERAQTKVLLSLLILTALSGIFAYTQYTEYKKLVAEIQKERAVELSYKATSPKGMVAGTILPASCESAVQWGPPLSGSYHEKNRINSSVGQQGMWLDAGETLRDDAINTCFTNNTGNIIFIPSGQSVPPALRSSYNTSGTIRVFQTGD